MQLPVSELSPPKYNRPPKNSPAAAWHNGNFGKPSCTYNTSVPDDQAVVYRRAYYSAVRVILRSMRAFEPHRPTSLSLI